MSLQASEIIIRPVISEKSMDQKERAKYTFAVHDKVTVLSVNVLTTQSKEKRRGVGRSRLKGRTSPWRKAIVTVSAGDKIEFFEGV